MKPKKQIKKKESSEYDKGFKRGMEIENKSWLMRCRCFSCGKICVLSATSDWCSKCWEEN